MFADGDIVRLIVPPHARMPEWEGLLARVANNEKRNPDLGETWLYPVDDRPDAKKLGDVCLSARDPFFWPPDFLTLVLKAG